MAGIDFNDILNYLPEEEPNWHDMIATSQGPYSNMPYMGFDEEGNPLIPGDKGSGVGLDSPYARRPGTEMTMEKLNLLQDIIAMSNMDYGQSMMTDEMFGMPTENFKSMSPESAHTMVDSLIQENDLSLILNDPNLIDSWSQWGIGEFPLEEYDSEKDRFIRGDVRDVSWNPKNLAFESYDEGNPSNLPSNDVPSEFNITKKIAKYVEAKRNVGATQKYDEEGLKELKNMLAGTVDLSIEQISNIIRSDNYLQHRRAAQLGQWPSRFKDDSSY